MKRKIVVIDTETGGIDASKHSILSIALCVLHGGGIDGKLYMLIKEPNIEATDEALVINKLTRSQLLAEGWSPGNAVDRIEAFLLEHDFRDPRKVTLGGCQTDFDVSFLKRLYGFTDRDYAKRYDRRVLDISHGALLLEQAGRLDLRGDAPSLENVSRALGVPLDRKDGHNALNDCETTTRVLSRMVDLLRHNDWPT